MYTKNKVCLEIKHRINTPNICYVGLSRHNWKFRPSLNEQTLNPQASNESTLVAERRKVKTLHKINRHLCFGNSEYGGRWNDELYEINGNIDIIQQIKRQRLRWQRRVVLIASNTPVLKVFDANCPFDGSRERVRPSLRWKGQVEKDQAFTWYFQFPPSDSGSHSFSYK